MYSKAYIKVPTVSLPSMSEVGLLQHVVRICSRMEFIHCAWP